MDTRTRLLASEDCTFTARITSDFTDSVYIFEMLCSADKGNNITFTVTQPEAISGITGIVGETYSGITFDEKILAFEELSDGQISPVSAPWFFLKALRGGFVRGCSEDEGAIQVILDDSYDSGKVRLHVWLDDQNLPFGAEIFANGRRVIKLDLEGFCIR